MNVSIPSERSRKLRLPRSKSVRKQLLSYIVIVGFTLLLIFSAILSVLISRETSQVVLSNAEQVTDALASQSVLALLTESEENIQEVFKQAMDFPNVVGVGLVNLSGDIFTWQGKPSAKQFFEQRDWSQSRGYKLRDEDPEHWYIASAVILNNISNEPSQTQLVTAQNEKLGYAIISFEKTTLHDLNTNILLIVIIAGSLGVLSLLLVSHIILKRTLAPLQSLSDVMAHNQRTGEHKRANFSGFVELEEMATSFNAMMDTLDEKDERLRFHRDKLEAEIKIRTQELTVARDAALSSSQHKSEFLANMTHELRTPIQSIMGYVDLVKEEAENEAFYDIIPDLDRVTRNADRLLGMVNCVLDLSKIEAGRMELNIESYYLADLISEVEAATTPLFPTNNNRFEIINKCDVKLLRIDHEKLIQVLINLVSNACKFTKNGVITLDVSANEHAIQFDVIDTGIGIAENDLPHVFQQFKQVSNGPDRDFSGSGLGLAISKQFCNLMRASLTVTSEVGKGSCFTVKLPC